MMGFGSERFRPLYWGGRECLRRKGGWKTAEIRDIRGGHARPRNSLKNGGSLTRLLCRFKESVSENLCFACQLWEANLGKSAVAAIKSKKNGRLAGDRK